MLATEVYRRENRQLLTETESRYVVRVSQIEEDGSCDVCNKSELAAACPTDPLSCVISILHDVTGKSWGK